MNVSVLVPWRPGCPWREKAWEWVQARYADRHPEWEIIAGTTDRDGFSRTQAILDARSRTDADILVVADADIWSGGLNAAVHYAATHGWAIPHLLIHRLAESSTLAFYGGEDWRTLNLSTDNRQDSRPYRGHEAGTLLVLTAEAFDTAPPDPRFVGWGQEDAAWSCALRSLVGPPWRGEADLVHLWHPAEQRKSRSIGNDANRALLRRYRTARTKEAMSALIEEGRNSDHRNSDHAVPSQAG